MSARRRTPGTLGALFTLLLVTPVGGIPGVGGSVTAQEVATSSRAGEGWIGLQVHLESEDRGAGRAATSLVVKNVLAESPAEAAGLRSGDRVLRINGREVGSSTLARLGSRLRPGDAVALTVERDGWQRVVRLRAGHRPDRAGAPPVPTELAHRLDSAVLRLDSVRVVLSGTGADAVSTVLARIEGMPSGVSVRRLAFTPDGDSLTAAGPVLRVDSILRIVGTAGDLDGTGWTGDDRTSFQVFVKQRADSAARQLQEMAPRTPQPPGSRSRVAVGFGTVPDPPEVRVPPGAVEPARAPSPPDDEGRPLSVYVAGANRVAGAEVTPLNPGLAAYFGANRGLLVTEVIPGTPAEEGGLRPGDVVVSVDGRPVDDLTDLRETLTRALRVRIERDAAGQTRPPGEAEGAAVEVVRKGRTLTLRLPH